MNLTRLELRRFTVFEDAVLEFDRGVNVLTGENGSGKSHVLKLVYALAECGRREALSLTDPVQPGASFDERVKSMLMGLFLPDSPGRLVKRAVGRRKAKVRLVWDTGASVEAEITSLGGVRARLAGDLRQVVPAVFLPPREMISAFPGFLGSWLKRESSFDRTYYELCVALDAKPLRGPRSPARGALLAPLEKAIGGTLDLVNGRFYCHQQNGENLEAPLMAEGLRKLGTLAWLTLNGSLMDRGLLCWDEPEANLNPRLVTLVRDTLLALVGAGAQALVATHDYLLASELSLASEYATDEPPRLTRFHALTHGKKGIEVERAALFQSLSANAILDAFGAHHDRRRELFLRGQEQ